MEPLLLTMQQASMMLGISRTKLYQLVQRGEIKSVHIGRARRVPRSALYEFAGEELTELTSVVLQKPNDGTGRNGQENDGEAIAWLANGRLVVDLKRVRRALALR